MARRDIVVIGGSSGGIEAVRTILAELPADLGASIFIVIHTAPASPGVLDRILGRVSLLPVGYAVNREPIRPRRVSIAPVDHHLILERDHVRTTRGPRENRFRPAVDPLFRTAAVAHRHRVIAIVLSGGQDDGAVGIGLVKQHGGIAIVQDPQEAVAPAMPLAAIRHVSADYVLGADEIAGVLRQLVAEPVPDVEIAMDEEETRDIAEIGGHMIHGAELAGSPAPLTCPECGGALWQFQDGEVLQFQCHVGHRYSGESLESAQTDGLDQALWAGLRALEESAELRRRMSAHARQHGMAAIAASYDGQAQESEERAGIIRRVLMPDARAEPASVEAVSSPSTEK
jgi:two-component system chemotaxis response regulator CheB